MHAAPIIDGLYVHVPFCDGKCHYCAFYSVPYDRDLAEAWLASLTKERQQALEQYGLLPLTSIFMGGGTPSLLPPDQMERLLLSLRSMGQGAALEWTSEANPGSLSLETLTMMKAFGVNRISLGVQAMTDPVLSQLGRRHSVADIYAAVHAIQQSGITNWGLDLIACIPGVTERDWQNTLEAALKLEPKHISVYALTQEEGTRLGRDCEAGVTALLDDDGQLRMLDVAEATLSAAGFVRYEISNYARPGFECQHNLSCWRGNNYLGLGCAAASRVGDQRWTNRADINSYIAGDRHQDRETLSPITDAVERLVFGLRMSEGINLDEILRITGTVQTPQAVIWEKNLERLGRDQLLERLSNHWRLTPKGRALADHVAVELMP